MSENKIKFPVKLASNNPQSFGVADAIEVSGHRAVDALSDLYAISDPILSILKDGSDAIGQEWFVVSEDCKYRLDNWENRKSISGWTKLPKQELISGKQSVSEKDQPNGYAGLDSNGKLPIEKTYGDTATVVEVETYELLPAPGLSGIIYYVSNTSAQYKWSGSAYIDITNGADNAKKNETSIFDCSNGTSTKYYSSLSAAINVVPPVYRTSNRIISYLSTESSPTSAVNYQYHGIDSTTWTDLTKWERIPNQSDLADIRSEVGVNIQTISFVGTTSGLVSLNKTFEEGEIIFVRLVSCDIDDTFIVGSKLANNGLTSEFIGNIREVGGYIKIAAPIKANQIQFAFINDTGSAIIEVSTYKLTQNVEKIEEDLENTNNDILELNEKLISETNNQNTENRRIESALDTLGFKVSPISNTIEVLAGTDINNTIYGNFKKGSILYLKADWDSNISTRESIAIVADYSETAIISIQNHVLTKLIIPRDTSYLRASMYRSLVEVDGNITFSIVDKLFIDSKDGYYPLQDGALGLNGVITYNSKRKTTGVINNNSPLYIQVDDAYSVAYLYGDDAYNLSDGGYIIDRGVNNNAVVDVDAKYIGFTIVKESAFNEDDDCKLIICKDGSVTKAIVKAINDLQSSIDNLYTKNFIKLVNGATWPDGLIHEVLGRRTTGIIKIDKPVKISLPKGYNAAVNVGLAPTGLTDLSYVIMDGGEYIVSGYNYMAVNIVLNNNNYQTDFPSDNNIGLIITDVDSFISELVERTNPIDVIKNQLILEQFYNTTTISDSKELIAISDAFDINNFGVIAAGYIGAEDAVGEYGSPTWKAYIAVANLADIHTTKKNILLFATWGTEKIDGWFVSFVQHCSAKFIDDDHIGTFTQVGLQLGDDQKVGWYYREYTISTETLSDPVLCNVSVHGTAYNLLYGTGTAAQSDIEAIWSATGLNHPYRREDENYRYEIALGMIKYGSVYYSVMQLGAQSNALCKSTDMIHWTYLCDMNFGYITLGEVALCINDGILYATARGDMQTVSASVARHYGTIKKCTLAQAEAGTPDWSDEITLGTTANERVTIECLNDKIYLMHGYGTHPITDGKAISRGNKVLYVVDLNLNILAQSDLSFTYPLLHPMFKKYGGNLFVVSCSDKRCLAWTKGGDARSEISVGHLNEHILGL